MAANDYYSVLGISKSASADDIKKAYRKLALEWHPDRHPNDKEAAEKKFKEINEAYQVLSDPRKKQTYDQYGQAGFGGGGAGGNYGPFTYSYNTSDGANPFGDFSDPFDIFAQFFGGGTSPFGARQARKPTYSLTIDFMEAIRGVRKTVDVEGKRRTIKIPPGVNTGNRINFNDFILAIEVAPHEVFEREGDDILVRMAIPFSLAALGGEIKVPTIDGQIKIKVRPGTIAGTTIRLKGEGAPHLNGHGKGDEYVRVNVEIPQHLNRNQRKLVEEMRSEGL